ncbi:MAG: ABC transporter permease subunit [Thermoleophilia bacterium]
MNILRHELRQNRNSTIIWTVSLIAIAGMYISIYPSISQSTDYSNLVNNFPAAFKKTFGISDSFMTAFSGLYAVVLNMVLLAGAVQAMNLGTNITSREMRDRTADFLLTKPVSRMSVLRQKLLSVFMLTVVTDIVFLAVGWGLIQALLNDQYQFSTFISSSLSLSLIQIFFIAFGILLGAVLPRIKSVIAVSLPAVFGFYTFGMLDTVIGEEKIKFLTPFKFFNLNTLTAGGGYEIGMLAYLAALTAGAVIASFAIYQKKDIRAL